MTETGVLQGFRGRYRPLGGELPLGFSLGYGEGHRCPLGGAGKTGRWRGEFPGIRAGESPCIFARNGPYKLY